MMGRTEDAIFPDVADVVTLGWRHIEDNCGILKFNKRKRLDIWFAISLKEEIDDNIIATRSYGYFHQAETSEDAEVK